MDRIKIYPPYKGVPIFKDYNVVDGEQVYIGNGQGCGTVWLKDLEEARKFIDKYRRRIKVADSGCVSMIPRKICLSCKNHYSYNTLKWKKTKEFACREYKKELKAQIR